MKKKKLHINIHLLLAVVLLAIVLIVVYRLVVWNSRSIEVDLSDINEGDYDMECLDYYIYPSEDYSDGHVDNGVEDILILGNALVNNFGEEHSIINILKERLDANIIDVTADQSLVASRSEDISYGYDSFSLYHLVSSICNKDYSYQKITEYPEVFSSYERYCDVIDNLDNLDLLDVDTVIIMYSLQDYYTKVPTLFADEKNVFGYHGALYSSIKMLQDNYPHLNIILASPIPVYMKDADGNIQLGTVTDYGLGNASIYINHQYAVATELCVSFIDNFFYKINESNIEEYSNGFLPNDKGIDLTAEHIIRFLETKGL